MSKFEINQAVVITMYDDRPAPVGHVQSVNHNEVYTIEGLDGVVYYIHKDDLEAYKPE